MSEIFNSSVLEAINRAKTYSSDYVDPSTLKVIVIDGETRNMTIPEGENIFGARGDKNVERKYFQCPKIVGDNIDLSQHLIYVNYVFTDIDSTTNLPETKIGMYHCEDVAVEGDNITFSWLLSGNVLHNPGFIAFKVCAKEKESDPTTVFNTTPAIGIVLYTIPDGSEIIPEEYPDIITQLLADMDATKEEVAAQIARIDAIKDQIEGAVEGTLINDNTESNIFTYSSQKINTELRKKATYYDSVASMKADSSLKDGSIAVTLGYYSENDGGGATYLIRAKQSYDEDDGGSIHELSSGQLVAELIIGGYVTPEMFGAKGDGITDDSLYFNRIRELNDTVIIVDGKYKINDDIIIQNSIKGHGTMDCVYNDHVDTPSIIIKNNCEYVSGIRTHGLSFKIESHNKKFEFTDCIIKKFGNGIFFYGTFSDILVHNNTLVDQLKFLSSEMKGKIYGSISVISSNVQGTLKIYNNTILNTCIFGINVYGGTYSNSFIIDSNYLKNIGINRDESDSDFSGCGGIYSNIARKGEVINNTIINVAEVGIEGSYTIVENNYIENTGAYYYKFKIGDNSAIYGTSEKIINNTVYGASGNGAISMYDETEEVCPKIYCNKLVDYERRLSSTKYRVGDYVAIGEYIYLANNTGTTSNNSVEAVEANIVDGDIQWVYVKRRCEVGIRAQGVRNVKVDGNSIIKFRSALYMVTETNRVENQIIDCDLISLDNSGFVTDTSGILLLKEDYSFNNNSIYGDVNDKSLLISSSGLLLVPEEVASKYNWINAYLEIEGDSITALSSGGSWISSINGSGILKASVSKKNLSVGTASGVSSIKSVTIIAG